MTDTPVTDSPVTDSPGTDSPGTDAPGTDAPVTDAEAADGVATGRVITSPSVAAYGFAAVLAAALLPTVFSSSVDSGTFTPKVFVLLLVAAVGAVPLVRLARSSRVTWAARGALTFLAVGLVSALLSPAVNLGFFGLYQWGTGWLFWFGCAGAFALGASLRPEQLNALAGGFVFAAAVNSVVAVFQVVAQPTGVLALYQGVQADGLLGNPIHLEGLLLGALALIAGRACVGRNRMVWWPFVLLVAVALEFTLERVALPMALVIIAGSLIAYGVRRAAPFAILTVAGYGVGYLSGGSGLGARVASGTATTYGTRFHIWGLALRGLVHHPLLGIGPGQVISLIAPHVSASFAAHLGPGTLPYDSHDFVIEVLATTGILGFLAFAAWGGGAACKARGPFLACAIAILAVELIEPLNVGVTPVALLALGAATVTLAGEPVGLAAFRQWRHHREVVVSEGATSAAGHSGVRTDADTTAAENGRRLQPATVITGLLVVASLFLGGTMVLGDHYLFISAGDAQAAPKIASASDANRLLPYWPDSAVAVAEGYQNASNISGSGSGPLKEALRWYLIAADRDPADPSLRDTTADIELQLGNRPAARQQELTALQRDPWTYFALEGLGTIERDSGNWQASLSWYKKALMVAPASNDLERLISSDEAHLRPD